MYYISVPTGIGWYTRAGAAAIYIYLVMTANDEVNVGVEFA